VKLAFISIGKTKDKNLLSLCENYFSRIKNYLPCETIEIKEDKSISSKDTRKIIQREGEKLSGYMGSGSYSIVFDENGKTLSTKDFSSLLTNLMNSGNKKINLIIGGPFGLSDEVRKNANSIISLSKLTFPHELAKTILLEQIYRALTIIKGQKYHY